MNRLYSWHIHQPLDLKSMQCAARDFLGTHDFLALTNERTDDSIRTIEHIAIHPMQEGRIRIANIARIAFFIKWPEIS